MSEVVSGEVVGAAWVGHSLEENEEIIGGGLRSFVEVGRALAVVRLERQYVVAGFDTFEEYCKERWDLTAGYVRQQIAAARVVDIASVAMATVPENERVARPLAKLLNDQGEDAVRTAWSQIVAKHADDGPITGREVSRFLTLGANYNKPGWHEMLGEVGDTLIKAEKQLTKVEGELTRKPSADFADKADLYAMWASHLAVRLRALKDGPS